MDTGLWEINELTSRSPLIKKISFDYTLCSAITQVAVLLVRLCVCLFVLSFVRLFVYLFVLFVQFVCLWFVRFCVCYLCQRVMFLVLFVTIITHKVMRWFVSNFNQRCMFQASEQPNTFWGQYGLWPGCRIRITIELNELVGVVKYYFNLNKYKNIYAVIVSLLLCMVTYVCMNTENRLNLWRHT